MAAMSPQDPRPERIYHLATRGDWLDATKAGVSYQRSTLGKSLAEEGFIHCSYASQLQTVADAVFRGRDDVVLLTIDPSRVPAEIRVENLDGGTELFPHIYGPLPVDAVLQRQAVPLLGDGRL